MKIDGFRKTRSSDFVKGGDIVDSADKAGDTQVEILNIDGSRKASRIPNLDTVASPSPSSSSPHNVTGQGTVHHHAFSFHPQ